MTVIAWDGRTLAADKQATVAGMVSTATKIHRLDDGLVAFSGSGAHAAELLHWFKSERRPESYPRRDPDSDSGAGSLFITRSGQVLMYSQSSPFPELVEDKFFARGAGRDYAMAAMHLGCDARRAVEVACMFDVSCGMGIDILEMK